jgi:carbonic anhydrase
MDVLPSIKSDPQYRDRIVEFESHEDIPRYWRGTPIESLIMAQNFHWPIPMTAKPDLMIATCIEFRYAIPVPRMYAYVVRRASGRLVGSEFTIGYALAKGIVHCALIGHNDCGMAQVPKSAPRVVDALVKQGWDKQLATDYVERHSERYSIGDELDALEDEFIRLSQLFPKMVFAPLFVSLYDSRLYLPKFYLEHMAHVKQQHFDYHVPDELILALN